MAAEPLSCLPPAIGSSLHLLVVLQPAVKVSWCVRSKQSPPPLGALKFTEGDGTRGKVCTPPAPPPSGTTVGLRSPNNRGGLSTFSNGLNNVFAYPVASILTLHVREMMYLRDPRRPT